MKRFILLFLLVSSAASLSALNRYEFILGLRTGAGAMLLDYNGSHFLYSGGDAGVYHDQSLGVTIPAQFEVLFGVKGFRFGYRFHYTHGIFQNFKRDFAINTPAVQDQSVNRSLRRNFFAHMFVLEYAIPASKTGKFAITPQVGIGGYRGYVRDMSTLEKTYFKNDFKTRIAVDVGLGFEFTKRRFSFVLAPTYTYYRIEPKTGDDYGQFHSFSLDMCFRLNLIKPRY